MDIKGRTPGLILTSAFFSFWGVFFTYFLLFALQSEFSHIMKGGHYIGKDTLFSLLGPIYLSTGIGILAMKEWGRLLGIFSSIISIAVFLLMLIQSNSTMALTAVNTLPFLLTTIYLSKKENLFSGDIPKLEK